MAFRDDVGDFFSEVGFRIDPSGRRLLDFFDIQAFFNAIPEEKYDCYDSAVDGAYFESEQSALIAMARGWGDCHACPSSLFEMIFALIGFVPVHRCTNARTHALLTHTH